MNINLSLIVCTRNRAPQLAESLQSLIRLRSVDSWELVIVDNGSTDETQQVIRTFDTSFALKTIVEPGGGLGKARNRGLAISQGEIVAFTDDDCYPAEDYLLSIARCFEEDNMLGFIGGRVLLHDPADDPITIQDKDSRQQLYPGDFLQAGLIQGANFAFRRAALESINGFDERFGAGALFPCEDCDAMARLLANGWQGAYDPRLLVYHHHRRRKEDEVKRQRKEYDRGRGAYYVKCILNPKLRATYLRNWYWAMGRQTWRVTARELVAGAEFMVRATATHLFPQLGR